MQRYLNSDNNDDIDAALDAPRQRHVTVFERSNTIFSNPMFTAPAAADASDGAAALTTVGDNQYEVLNMLNRPPIGES